MKLSSPRFNNLIIFGGILIYLSVCILGLELIDENGERQKVGTSCMVSDQSQLYPTLPKHSSILLLQIPTGASGYHAYKVNYVNPNIHVWIIHKSQNDLGLYASIINMVQLLCKGLICSIGQLFTST